MYDFVVYLVATKQLIIEGRAFTSIASITYIIKFFVICLLQKIITMWELSSLVFNNLTSNWKNPPLHFLKCDVDAALFWKHRKVGVGMVLRDLVGDFVASTTVWFEGLYQVHEAEALGVRKTLSWIKERGLNNVILETDSPVVISTIQGCSSLLNEFGLRIVLIY